MSESDMPRALIAGLGLIGGSIGKALRGRGWRVAYLDPGVEAPDFERVSAFEEADLTILATPVDVARAQIEQAVGLTTSVCSVMLRGGGDNFIAGHPMAGSAKSGFEHSRADLFEGATWFIEREHPLILRMIADCGAKPRVIDPDEHDRLVALISHLPQVLSTALGAYLDRESRVASRESDLAGAAGSGLKTFLRLAESDARVWRPILEANRDNLAPHIEGVLEIAREMLEGDPTASFEEARAFWQRLND